MLPPGSIDETEPIEAAEPVEIEDTSNLCCLICICDDGLFLVYIVKMDIG